MIGFLSRIFLGRVTRIEAVEDSIERAIAYIHRLQLHIDGMQHQIEQLAAALIELRKDKLVVKDGKLQRWMPPVEYSTITVTFGDKQEQARAKRMASKKTTTKPKAKQ